MQKEKIKKIIDELYKEEAGKERDIYIFEDVGEEVSERVIRELIRLERENQEEDINIYISSYGGLVSSAIAMHDYIQNMSCKVNTLALGVVLSAGSLLLMSGTGERIIYPNTRIMIHELNTAYNRASYTDIEVEQEETRAVHENLINIYSKHTGQSKEKIRKDFKRNKYMSAEEAVEYGLADQVLRAEN